MTAHGSCIEHHSIRLRFPDTHGRTCFIGDLSCSSFVFGCRSRHFLVPSLLVECGKLGGGWSEKRGIAMNRHGGVVVLADNAASSH